MRTRPVALILILVALASLAGLWFGAAASGATPPTDGAHALPPILVAPEAGDAVQRSWTPASKANVRVLKSDDGALLLLDPAKGFLLRGLKDVSVSANPAGGYEAHVALLSEDKARFARLSKENVGRRVAVVIGDCVLTAPVMESAIPNGELVITCSLRGGSDTLLELKPYIVGPSWLVYAGMALAGLLLLIGLALLVRGEGHRPLPPENP